MPNNFFCEKYDYRFGTPEKMEIEEWKSKVETEIKAGEHSVRVSGNYSVLLIKNSALPLELMDQGHGIETSMVQAHHLVSTIVHALCGIHWSVLADQLDFYENEVRNVMSLPTLNLIMQGCFEMLRILREEEIMDLNMMEEKARIVGVALRDEMGYNPFRNPHFYHKAYKTNWGNK